MKRNLLILKRYIKLVCEANLITPEEIDVGEGEYEKYGPSQNALIAAMKAWNLNLIPRFKQSDHSLDGGGYITSGFIGKGAYGKVYEVAQGSKRFALKITDSDKDAEAYSNAMELRKSLPAVPASVLPVIFKQNKFGDYYVTLMEYLNPIPDKIKLSMWGSLNYINSGITRGIITKLNVDFLKNAVDETLIKIFNDESIVNDFKDQPLWNKFKNLAQIGKIFPEVFDNQLEIKRVSHDIVYLMFETYIKNNELKISAFNAYNAFFDAWGKFIDFNQKIDFPLSSYSKNNNSKLFSHPKAKKLLLGLRWLIQKKHLKVWNDANDANVMVRPSTGDFVVADVGMFNF